MSWLSQITGVHVSPKGFSVEPAKLLGDAAALAIPGVGGELSKIPLIGSALGGLANKVSGAGHAPAIAAAMPMIKNAVGSAPATAGADQSGGGGILNSLEGLLTGNGGLNALGAAEGVNAAMQQKQSTNYAKSALGGVQQSYDARAPLRAAGIAGLTNPQIPSLSGLSSIAGRNPFASGQSTGPISTNQQMTMGPSNPALAPVNMARAA